MTEEKYLLLKLSDKEHNIPFGNSDDLIKRANGSWKLNPSTVSGINTAFLLFRGQILAEYKIGSTLIYNREVHRISFDMSENKNSKYINKNLKSRTANPASTITVEDFKNNLF
ncbi:hypothetical protein DY052_06080 [Apilactobacillus timberlakei]|uniref:hypothetical protein n=1 Tax=Apilactobacillus timberlakei TaxID=2008380 RepID=UPI00112D434E|nr:hypothetical protein [Apilactobacillus timberlakei]TPR14992.1 hypothetical protein DY052_06080 [Apilactobacillus timberlakei]